MAAKVRGVKVRGRTFKLCSHDVLKTRCPQCSPHKFCPCGTLIKNCPKCVSHIGRCGCGKSRSMCRIHGGWCLCKCGKSSMHSSRCSVCGSGSKLCEHKRRVNNCPTCLGAAQADGVASPYLTNGGEWCPCGKARKHCSKHGGVLPPPLNNPATTTTTAISATTTTATP
jgi:hypothetical protein